MLHRDDFYDVSKKKTLIRLSIDSVKRDFNFTITRSFHENMSFLFIPFFQTEEDEKNKCAVICDCQHKHLIVWRLNYISYCKLRNKSLSIHLGSERNQKRHHRKKQDTQNRQTCRLKSLSIKSKNLQIFAGTEMLNFNMKHLEVIIKILKEC